VVLFRKGVFKKTASIHSSILTGTEKQIIVFIAVYVMTYVQKMQ